MKHTDKKPIPDNVSVRIFFWSDLGYPVMKAEPENFLIAKYVPRGLAKGEPTDILNVVSMIITEWKEASPAAAMWTVDGTTYWYSVETGLCERKVADFLSGY